MSELVLTLILDGKKKTFKNKGITIEQFKKSVDYIPRYLEGEFLGDGYPLSELEEAINFVCDYFSVSVEDFNKGYIMVDGIDFLMLFNNVLNQIQINKGKRELGEGDDEGKSEKN